MAEILGLGLSHYPLFCRPDADMAKPLGWYLEDPDIPEDAKRMENWPAGMRAEWSDDRGEAAAGRHRAACVAAFDRLRARLDEFRPDVVVVWGDDQYENFREDVIPPWTVCIYDDMEVYPWGHAQQSANVRNQKNVWNETEDTHFLLRGRPDIARHLTEGLLDQGIDISYAYKPLHHPSIGHAFLNAILFLDYHRRGWQHPVVMVPLNCYGRKVVSTKAFLTRMGFKADPDPPSPSPRRFMQMGAATARVLAESPWRVALIGSSSWSHAFLCDRTWRLRPDLDADRRMYEAMTRADYDYWRSVSLKDIEAAGQQEILNWYALLGAMEEIGAKLAWSEMAESYIFNSDKVFAEFTVAGGKK